MKSKLNIIFYIFLFITLFIPNISAICEENQIDINEASKEKLDELYGIGPVKAQAIVESRPFDSVDDLIKVNGIGEITLDKIKDQNLACVKEEIVEDNLEEILEENLDSEEIVQEEENDVAPSEEPNEEKMSEINVNKFEEIKLDKFEKQNEVSVINLTKNIKTKDSNENTSRTYAIYGFIVFCILLIVLFILKKNRFENEFV